MDDFFGEIDCSSKPDSIVMTLLRSAMDKAHENVQSQNGPIEFLHKRSKFYELAAISVDCGLGIVREEEDILETSREKMFSDLTEIKEWLRRRIEEMQLLIMEKDRELQEREENEMKLRHALELNERELIYLQEKLEFERTKSQDLQDFIPRNQDRDGEDESHEGGDICELKNSVDQQVLSIKRKLEDGRRSLTRKRRASISCTSDNELYSQLLEISRHSGSELPEIKPLSSPSKPRKNNEMYQQMSSEIDILKGTLDLAFGRMQNAEVFPLEKQWKWNIERDMLLVSLRGFISDMKERFEAEFEKKDCVFPLAFYGEKRREFIYEMRNLHYELKDLCNQINIEEKQSNMQEMSAPRPSIRRTTSEPLPEFLLKPPDKDKDSSGSRYVARLVKNHESFIQKQRKRDECNWVKREIARRKGSSSIKKGNKDPDELESRIKNAIKVLERLIKLDYSFGEDKNYYYNTNVVEANPRKFGRAATKDDEMRKLRQERDDLEVQILMMEEIFFLVFQGSMKSLQVEGFNYEKENHSKGDQNNRASMADEHDDHGITETYNLPSEKTGKLEEQTAHNFLQHYLESSVREEVYRVYFPEAITEWKTEMECEADDCLLQEEICRIVLGESIKCIERTGISVRTRLQMEMEDSETTMANLSCSNILKEEIYAVYLRELLQECRTEKETSDIEISIREEIYPLFMAEMTAGFLHDTPERPAGKLEKTKCFENDDLSPAELEIIERTSCTANERMEISVQELLQNEESAAEKEHNPEKKSTDDHRTQMDRIEIESEKQHPSCEPEQNDDRQQQNESLFLPLMEFQQAFTEFELSVHKKLESNCSRVDQLKHQINALARPASSLRKKKSLYKKAFIRRSQNLSLAETEVDLLGNQVDKVLCLLQNIYLILHQNSAALSPYIGVYDILGWIKKELGTGAAFRPDLAT